MTKLVYLSGLILLFNTSVLSQWDMIGFGDIRIFALAVKEDHIFAGGNDQVYRSIDAGINWDTLTTFSTMYIEVIKPINQFLLVGQDRGCFSNCTPKTSIYKSTDNGLTWDSVYASILGTTQIQPFNQMIFANSDGYLIRSSDDGDTWEIETSIEHAGNPVVSVAGNDTALFVSRSEDSLYRSFDNGSTWHTIENGLPNDSKWEINARNDTIFVFAGSVYRSIDNGYNWELVDNGLPNGIGLYELFWEDTHLFATSFDNRIFMTPINNINWIDISEGLIVRGHADITDITKTEKYLFASTVYNGIWRRPISEVVSINDSDQNIISKKNNILLQNYPNPFNPSTTIEYYISKPEFITLTVYNDLGEIIEVIDQEFKSIGYHKTEFDGKRYPSGIYFYNLNVGEFSETKSMILLK